MERKYDVAAYVWPSFTGDEFRTRIFWPEGYGEWETIRTAKPKFEGHEWPRKPLWGFVNEADRYVMEMQINAAVDHHVNVFIYDWYWYDGRPFLENCLNNGFLKAGNNDRMKFYIMWANHDVAYSWDRRISDVKDMDHGNSGYLYTGQVDRSRFEEIGKRLIERYFSHPSYYRIDGKPLFMIFTLPVLVEGLGGIRNTKEALEWLRAECVKAGLGGLHLQMNFHSVCYGIKGEDGRFIRIKDLIKYLGFDSATNYQMIDIVKREDKDYAEAVEEAKDAWERLDKETEGIPYFPQVSVGWDDNPRFQDVRHPILSHSTPEKFAKGLANAKAFLDARPDQVPLVTINSWNEWTEASYLEPDDIHGYGMLEAVRRVFGDPNQDKGREY